ncbi:MAG: adenylosuccinate lyase [Candidatus Neomarinimicrobiota bacterium]
MPDPLNTISPLDGRYGVDLEELSGYFSESALMQRRVKIEIEYLISLCAEKGIPELSELTNKKKAGLRNIYENFNLKEARRIKTIETETAHDVKAVEYYIQERLGKSNQNRLVNWIHFALTSEDINNLSYSLMWQEALRDVYIPCLKSLKKNLIKLARNYRSLPLLALTHGQAATPTSFGKEMAVFAMRLKRQTAQLEKQKLQGKLGGATGTWSAHIHAYPRVNWLSFSKKFIRQLGLDPNLVTTQIEAHDSAAESYHALIRINSILIDFCQDIWNYISRGILGQKKVKNEVGSSTMPHKINPINFENAEGNLGLSSALLNHLALKLPVSRMQRDLSDSTTLRNQGTALAHSYLALNNILKGLSRLTVNKLKMAAELDRHWEVLAEAVQITLRKAGQPNAYEQIKKLTRGQSISRESIMNFVENLSLSKADKKALLNLSPEQYLGLAPKLIDLL